ncbi:aminotransferase class V-fold PLP-dependent enzyme [Bombilactobacillus folatiphilus]|uniref:Aminotransferase class V-fold PLP-dependent enzyme n=1 Tax=Bombilactobacillus folatiphilus TaxID=2923362 RepID=A0ABY4P8M7_9LACO|nr:aminotransferase class V-fold PLP-dependent enzyme [Bombilactobacillus folatiphilus]UQS81891.1 aminotransferase class V-fold PLP-dependent enzyme [Bombilactobacillus folatiphilus]
MISFENDYLAGAHPQVLQALNNYNLQQEPGYGQDILTQMAIEKLQQVMNCPEANIYFLSGGTQTNQVVIDTMLTKYQGVITVQSGHINDHEAGSIEFSGHKVLPLTSTDGKISAKQLQTYMEAWHVDPNHGQMVIPKMVYLSYPTELGTIYSKAELTKIAQTCRQNDLLLYIDGARLGYGLMSPQADLTLADLAHLSDIFYIGGTKVGALYGEALVFTHNNAPAHFSLALKQHGALLAKGRGISTQFLALFTDDLYFQISQQADNFALQIKAALQAKHYQLFVDSPTNQQFFIMPKQQMTEFQDKLKFNHWSTFDSEHDVVRCVTSWATTAQQVEFLIAQL